MPEFEPSEDLQKQIENCPIHQWTDVKKYMDLFRVPKELRVPFHKILVARGQFPLDMSYENRDDWAITAGKVFKEHNLEIEDRNGLLILFVNLTDSWRKQQVRNN